jgi:hypothetical protein
MQDTWEIPQIRAKNLISIPEICLEVSDQAFEVLLLRPVIERENDQIRCDDEDKEEEPQP